MTESKDFFNILKPNCPIMKEFEAIKWVASNPTWLFLKGLKNSSDSVVSEPILPVAQKLRNAEKIAYVLTHLDEFK